MRHKIMNAVGFGILGILLLLMSGATGGPLNNADENTLALITELSK